MINIIASIHVKEGKVQKFIDILKANVPAVLKEKGCIEYLPAIDLKTDIYRCSFLYVEAKYR